MKTPYVVLIVAAALPALAAQPASPDPLLACADITDGAARLQCFDRNAAAARASTVPAASPAAAPPPAAPQSVPPPEQRARSSGSGFGEEQIRGRVQEPEQEAALQARITESRRSTGGVYVVTLDNGQVWQHEMGSMADYLRVGEAVTIRRASLGSYRLTLDDGRDKNWVRVTRIR